ncbi:MAG: hypothetical protein WCK91_02565 [bacterium]
MANRNSVKIVNGALDELTIEGIGTQIVLRGVVDNDSLELLQVDSYQREILPESKIRDLIEAMKTGRLPDIELGMRGGQFAERDGAFYLQDPMFIIDGLQRTSAAKHMLHLKYQGVVGVAPRLGVLVFFNSTENWERERFRILNSLRTRLSPNVLIRNSGKEFPAIETLHNLCDDKTFVMAGRICWRQNMTREELISAHTFCKTVGLLHSHIGPGRNTDAAQVARGLQKIYETCGRNTFRDNVKIFFDVIEQAFGIRLITFKAGASYMHWNFLRVLADVFSHHTDFWRENRLFVDQDLIRKIKTFPLSDPNIRSLCSSSGQANKLLYQLLVDHINSGRRTRRLHSRTGHSLAIDTHSGESE